MNTLTNKIIVLLLFIFSINPIVKSEIPDNPNVIIILADDYGWTDWEGGGSTFYETPNLNAFKDDGMYFSQAYAHPLCSPSRSALMSGKYPGARIHMHQAITGGSVANPKVPATSGANNKVCWPDSRNHMPLDEITIAEELKKEGYTTIQLGKWHVGNSAYYPTKQGFDIERAVGGAGPGSGGYIAPFTLDNFPAYENGDYLTDKLTDVACEYIEQYQDEPFFMYFAHYAVHAPYEGKPELVSKYDAKMQDHLSNRHRHPEMAAMIESLDESVGRIIAKTEEVGIDSNTLIILMGDNGGIHWANDRNEYSDIVVTSNFPLRAGKACFYEGGVRVPMLAKFPGVIPTSIEQTTPVHIVDFYPTILDFVGSSVSAEKDILDGVSIKSLLTNAGNIDERPIFCHFPRKKQIGAPVGGSYVRSGNYKLCMFWGDTPSGNNRYELYDLTTDIGENNNIAAANPEIVAELSALLNDWILETGALRPHRNPNHTNFANYLAPTVVGASGENGHVIVDWIDIIEDEMLSYSVYKGSDANNLTLVAEGLKTSKYIDNNVVNGTEYFYKVSANYDDNSEPVSGVVSATPSESGTVPPASNLIATAGDDSVSLNWDAINHAEFQYFAVYRGTNAQNLSLLANNITTNSYIDKTAENGTSYVYQVEANYQGGSKLVSNFAYAEPVLAHLAPTGIKANANAGIVNLNWNAIDRELLSHYAVLRGTSADNLTEVQNNIDGTSWSDNSVSNNTTYYYKVKAVYSDAVEILSTAFVTATPKDTPETQEVYITHKASNKRLALNGDLLVTKTADDNDNTQVWQKVYADISNFYLVNKSSGKRINAPNKNSLKIVASNTGTSAQWSLETASGDWMNIKSKEYNKFLHLNADGVSGHSLKWTSTSNTQWKFEQAITSLNSTNSESIHIFPNPVKSVLQIEGILSNSLLSIYNLDGKQIYSGNSNTTEHSIDLTEQLPGVYILAIQQSNLTNTYKFTIE